MLLHAVGDEGGIGVNGADGGTGLDAEITAPHLAHTHLDDQVGVLGGLGHDTARILHQLGQLEVDGGLAAVDRADAFGGQAQNLTLALVVHQGGVALRGAGEVIGQLLAVQDVHIHGEHQRGRIGAGLGGLLGGSLGGHLTVGGYLGGILLRLGGSLGRRRGGHVSLAAVASGHGQAETQEQKCRQAQKYKTVAHKSPSFGVIQVRL